MKKFIALSTIALLFLGACNSVIKPPDTFITALSAEPPAIDPANAIDGSSQQVTQQLFDGLVKNNPRTLAIEPAVAKSWETSKDAKTFTFHLKKGIKFHNGEEVTAQNFKEAADYIANPKNKAQASYYFEQIEGYANLQDKKAKELTGVQVIDKYTLKVMLSSSLVDFVRNLASTAFSPLPKNFKEKGFAKHPIGNGPFQFVSAKRNKEIVLKKFDGYYDQKAKLKKVVFKIFADQNAGLREFQAGTLDDTIVPQNRVNTLKTTANEKLVTVPLLSTYSYGFNLKKKPWDNEKLRLAIAHAINKQEIIDKTQPKGTVAATSFTAKAVPGNNEPLITTKYDIAKTKSLLKEAGFENTKDVGTFTLAYSTDNAGNDKVAQVMQSQLEKAGFEVKIQGLEEGTFIDKMLGGQLEMFQMSWFGDANFDAFLDPIFSTDSIGMNNVTNYSNSDVDDLILEAQATIDENKRIATYKKAEKKILAEAPIIPLYYDTATYVVNKNVKGYHRNAFEELPLEQMWLDR